MVMAIDIIMDAVMVMVIETVMVTVMVMVMVTVMVTVMVGGKLRNEHTRCVIGRWESKLKNN